MFGEYNNEEGPNKEEKSSSYKTYLGRSKGPCTGNEVRGGWVINVGPEVVKISCTQPFSKASPKSQKHTGPC